MSLSRAPRAALLTAVVAGGALVLSACSGDSNGKSGGGGDTNFVTDTGGISTVAKGKRTAPARSPARPSTASSSTSPTSRARSS